MAGEWRESVMPESPSSRRVLSAPSCTPTITWETESPSYRLKPFEVDASITRSCQRSRGRKPEISRVIGCNRATFCSLGAACKLLGTSGAFARRRTASFAAQVPFAFALTATAAKWSRTFYLMSLPTQRRWTGSSSTRLAQRCPISMKASSALSHSKFLHFPNSAPSPTSSARWTTRSS